jgi:hypothetical protein
MNNSPFRADEFLDFPETKHENRAWFMREFVLAMAKGGHSPNLEHTISHARKLFDAIEAENGKE